MKYLFDRLREPSTWSGLGILAAMFGVPTGTFGLIQQVAMGITGLLSVLAPEAPHIVGAPDVAAAPAVRTDPGAGT